MISPGHVCWVLAVLPVTVYLLAKNVALVGLVSALGNLVLVGWRLVDRRAFEPAPRLGPVDWSIIGGAVGVVLVIFALPAKVRGNPWLTVSIWTLAFVGLGVHFQFGH